MDDNSMKDQGAMPVPRRGRFLLRGGYVVTLDDRLGELAADILVADGKIREVGRGSTATSRWSMPPTI